MENHIKELFLFVAEPEVPPDNNAAERSLRPVVISRKISGGTRSAAGTNTKMTLASIFGTWRVQGFNPLTACRQLLTSPRPEQLPKGLLKKPVMLPIHAGCPATTPGQSGIDEDDDDPTSGLLQQGFHTVPVHHQAVAGFDLPRPPADQIDERLDFNKLVARLEECYCPDLEHE